MDASKAFDKVNHWVLFEKLLHRGLPTAIVRLLSAWYGSQEFYIKWAGCSSSSFKVSNGVRQGGILSPILYNVFMDDLSALLSRSYSGCFFNKQCHNHLFYADDSVLMAPSPGALQNLLNICQKYASECEIKYNVKKTVCMCIKPKERGNVSVPDVTLDGKCLKWIAEHKYLGVIIREDLKDDVDIQRQLRSLYARGNLLVRKFKKCSVDVKIQLFKSYCTNLYCAPLWCLYTMTMFNRLKVAYNNVFRSLMYVGRRGLSVAFLLYNVDSFKVVLRKAIFSFKKRLCKSANGVVANLINSMFFVTASKMNTVWTQALYREMS